MTAYLHQRVSGDKFRHMSNDLTTQASAFYAICRSQIKPDYWLQALRETS